MNSTGMCSSDDEDDATDDANDGDAKEGSTISDAIEINSNTENRSEREREREKQTALSIAQSGPYENRSPGDAFLTLCWSVELDSNKKNC